MNDAWLPPSRPARAPRWVRDLEAIDQMLQEHADVRERLADVVGKALKGQDMGSLSAEQWLRVLLVQQTSRRDNGDMGLWLNDVRTCRAFCRLVDVYLPDATIRANLRCLDQALWQQIEPVLRSHLGTAWNKQYSKRVDG